MLSYLVTFRWHETDTWCSNIAKAKSEEAVRSYYQNTLHIIDIYINPLSSMEVEIYAERNMPIVTIEN